MADTPYKLIIDDGYFHVEGPELQMASLDRFVQPPPANRLVDPQKYSKRSADKIIDMLNRAFKAGQNTPRVPSIITDGH